MQIPYHTSVLVLLGARRSNAFVFHPPVSVSVSGAATPLQLPPLSLAKDDGDGWFDDYDEFVEKLDFGGGGWDNGADAPFESAGRGRGGGRGQGRGRGGGRGGGRGNFGRSGHDYARDPRDATADVDVGEVDRLLASRLQFRRTGDFDAADGIRDELTNRHGVSVWDKELTWTASSDAGFRGGPDGGRGGQGGGRGGRGGRGRGRAGRGSGRGAGRDRQFNEHGHDYARAGGPDAPDMALDAEAMHDLIRERMECKFARDFGRADAIQNDLADAGVLIHDGLKEWRVDGEEWSYGNRRDRDGPGGGFGSARRGPKEYVQRGPGTGLAAETVDTIAALVAERAEHKVNAEYARADAIFDRLADEFAVNVDDRRGEWAVLVEEYLLREDATASVPDEEAQRDIETKLGERTLARKDREFERADDIREELRREYMVEVYDSDKEWAVVAPEGERWAAGAGEDGGNNGESRDDWELEEDDVDNGSVGDDDNDIDTIEAEDGTNAGDGGNNVESREKWELEEDDVDHGSVGDDDNDVDTIEAKDGTNDGSSPWDEATLSSCTVPELKVKLREAGLPVSGRKSELISRLIAG